MEEIIGLLLLTGVGPYLLLLWIIYKVEKGSLTDYQLAKKNSSYRKNGKVNSWILFSLLPIIFLAIDFSLDISFLEWLSFVLICAYFLLSIFHTAKMMLTPKSSLVGILLTSVCSFGSIIFFIIGWFLISTESWGSLFWICMSNPFSVTWKGHWVKCKVNQSSLSSLRDSEVTEMSQMKQ